VFKGLSVARRHCIGSRRGCAIAEFRKSLSTIEHRTKQQPCVPLLVIPAQAGIQ
jgi:hypothetical protein